MKKYNHVEEAICRELEKLDKKYAGDTEMTMQDLEMIRLLYSAMTKAKTIHAMGDDRDDWRDDRRDDRYGRESDRGRYRDSQYGRY